MSNRVNVTTTQPNSVVLPQLQRNAKIAQLRSAITEQSTQLQALERANAHAVSMQKSRRNRTARRKFVQSVKTSAYHNRFTIGLSLIVALTFLAGAGFQAIQNGLFNVDPVSTQADGYPE